MDVNLGEKSTRKWVHVSSVRRYDICRQWRVVTVAVAAPNRNLWNFQKKKNHRKCFEFPFISLNNSNLFKGRKC